MIKSQLSLAIATKTNLILPAKIAREMDKNLNTIIVDHCLKCPLFYECNYPREIEMQYISTI